MTAQPIAPTPMKIFEALNAYQLTAALKSAIELDLFTLIGSGAASAADLALKMGAQTRGVRILCDYLTMSGFLTKGKEAYALTPESELFLVKGSPAYLGSAVFFLANSSVLDEFRDLTTIVRSGKSSEGTVSPENPVWIDFAKSMAPMMAPTAQAVATMTVVPGQKMKVLDIAAGHGLFGISIAKWNPAAEIVALDWKSVLQVALENARAAGVSDRYSVIEGSAFEVDFGSGYDLILIPNFLHHFDEATNVELLRKVRAALNPGGYVATVEFVPEEDRITPPHAGRFAMIMLGSTKHGDAYTFQDLDRMFRAAGFGESTSQPIPMGPSTLVLTKV